MHLDATGSFGSLSWVAVGQNVTAKEGREWG